MAFLCDELYEWTEKRREYRNGYKPRMLKTRMGWLPVIVL